MRTIFVGLTVLVMTTLLGPVVVVARLLRVPQGPTSIYARCVRLWARTLNRAAGVRVRVHGAERLQNARGAVAIANHVSWFDIFPLAAEVPWCSFVAKSEIRRLPLFGFAAECVGIVFLDRDNRKQAFESYKVAAAEVQRGRTIVVCPEGTRGTDYRLRPFKKGPFVLAIASQSPVIPTIVHGAREVMPKGSFWIRPGTVDLHFLEPVPTEGLAYHDRTELMTDVWARMADALDELYGVATTDDPVAKQA
ncbi:MAG: lysophospholipid acyltransferase family protein [bacterium]